MLRQKNIYRKTYEGIKKAVEALSRKGYEILFQPLHLKYIAFEKETGYWHAIMRKKQNPK